MVFQAFILLWVWQKPLKIIHKHCRTSRYHPRLPQHGQLEMRHLLHKMKKKRYSLLFLQAWRGQAGSYCSVSSLVAIDSGLLFILAIFNMYFQPKCLAICLVHTRNRSKLWSAIISSVKKRPGNKVESALVYCSNFPKFGFTIRTLLQVFERERCTFHG